MTLNILVVDDEDIIRDGLVKKINRLFPGANVVGKAPSARAALQMLDELRPNVIITDIRMPEIDGLQFIGKVKERFRDIKFIVISGYQEFEYARSAIKLGVEDYLLKPVENDKLKEILTSLEEKIAREAQHTSYVSELKQKLSGSSNFMKSKYLTDMIYRDSHTDISYMVKNLSITGVDFPFPRFTVVCIAVSSYENNPMFPYKEDIPLLKFAVENIAGEILSAAGTVAAFENLKDETQIIAMINHAAEHEKRGAASVNKLCTNLLDALGKHLGLSAIIGIGRSCENIGNLPDSYYESYTAVKQKIVLGLGKVIDFKDVLHSSSTTFLLQNEKSMLLVNSIKEGNSKKANEIIHEIFSLIEKSCPSYSSIKAVYIDLIILFIRTVKEAGGSWEKIFPEDIMSEACLSRYNSLSSLYAWIRECIVSICSYIGELRKNESKRVIDEVKDYITNYYYTDINLNTLASKYFINPSYLSQLFKNEAGENFIDYLTGIRMEKAMDLLKNTDFKAYKIGEMVGYGNARYFGDLFQKCTGMTPTEYRKILSENA